MSIPYLKERPTMAKKASGARTSLSFGWRAIFLVVLFIFLALHLFVGLQQNRQLIETAMEVPYSSSLPSNRKLRYDSSDATVMAYAMGYGLQTYQRFVGSLRNSGFTGNIILLVSSSLNAEVEDYLVSKNVIFHTAQITNCSYDLGDMVKDNSSHSMEAKTCIHPYPDLKARWSRFPILRDYLVECKKCTGPVLVTDFRDTFFQRDPFGDGAHEVEGLEVFEESKAIKTDNWIVDFPVSKCKNVSLVEPMLCSGTTIGTREAIVHYLTIMQKEMQAWMKDPNCCCNLQNGDDQSIHNYLFYTNKLPFAKAVANRIGTVNTVGFQASRIFNSHKNNLVDLVDTVDDGKAARTPYYGSDDKGRWLGDQFELIDNEGYLTQFDGTRSRVIHQYDRFGGGIGYDGWIMKKKGELWP